MFTGSVIVEPAVKPQTLVVDRDITGSIRIIIGKASSEAIG
jgi:hypothetical protein